MERLISSELTLPVPHGSGAALVDGEPAQLDTKGDWLVIDAWAWVHYVWHSMNTNVYQGFELVVVIDGPRLHQKLGSTLSRTQNYVRLNAKLMRAGPKLRTDHEFEHGRILPPGLSECLFNVLDHYHVECRVGAEEVDAAIAELANERGGYVLSRDSDFLILCGNAPQCKGYVPLSSIEFVAQETGDAPVEAPVEQEDDDGFTTVSTAKSKRGKKQQAAAKRANLPHLLRAPVLPAQQTQLKETAVRFQCYSAYRCATQLQLPMTLLPIFAALVGTEHRSAAHVELFNTVFHGVTNRMPAIASLLTEQYTATKNDEGAASNPPADTDAGEHAIDLRDPVLRLLARTFDAAVEYGRKRRGAQISVSWEMRKAIVENMHTVALSYMPGHGDEAIDRFMAPSDIPALKAYQEAYWKRNLDQVMVSVLLERIYIARVFLEEPEEPSTQRVVVRPLRNLVWSTLLAVWLAAHPDPIEPVALADEVGHVTLADEGDTAAEDVEAEAEDDEDEDEDDAEAAAETEELTPEEDHALAHITEYTRTEYSLRKEEVPVYPLAEVLASLSKDGTALPTSLQTLVDQHTKALDAGEQPPALYAPELAEETRLELWLYAHRALTPSVRALPEDVWPIAAALRYVVVANHERLGTMRAKNNWTQTEIEAAVYAACVARRLHAEAPPADLQAVTDAYPAGSPPNRSITLSTMLAFALETSTMLTQALLLSHRFTYALHEPPLFHARLNEPNDGASMPWTQYEDPALYTQLLHAVTDGLDRSIGRARTAKPASQRAHAPRQRRHHGLLSETML